MGEAVYQIGQLITRIHATPVDMITTGKAYRVMNTMGRDVLIFDDNGCPYYISFVHTETRWALVPTPTNDSVVHLLKQ